jgi:hypothetical protein
MINDIIELQRFRLTRLPLTLPESGPAVLHVRGPRGSPGAPGGNGTNGVDGAPGTSGSDGDDGREVELQKTATHIQWRYVGDVSWTNLVALTDIKGDQGNAGTNGANGTNGTNGDDGRDVELQTSATHIQWRYVGDASWTNLVALADIKGDQGNPGTPGTNGTNGTIGVDGDDGREVELQTSATHVQWRYAGDVSWTNLVALADIKGDPGPGSTYVESSPIAFAATTDGSHSFAHGLGVRPKQWGAYMQCKVANNGYAVGERLDLPYFRATAFLYTASVNATTMTLSWDNIPTAIGYFAPKGGGTAVLPVAADWDFILWAEA